MGINIDLQTFCKERGVVYKGKEVKSGYMVMIVCDLNSPDTANKLWNGDMAKIGLETIESICRGLGCEPNDIFHFDPPLRQSRPPVTFTQPKRRAKSAKTKKVKEPEKKARLRLIS